MILYLVTGCALCIIFCRAEVIQRRNVEIKDTDAVEDNPEAICVPPKIDKSFLSVENNTFFEGDTVEIKCEEGYRFPDIKSTVIQVVCQPVGTWLDVVTHQSLPECERIGSCPVPKIKYGEVLSKPGGYMPGDVAPVRCDASERQNIVCKNDGTWSQPDMSCIARNCSLPQSIEHVGYHLFTLQNVSSGDVPEGTKVVYFCTEGYTLANKNVAFMTCSQGKWDGVLPVCVLQKNNSLCGKPETVANSYYSLYGDSNGDLKQGGKFTEGTTVVYFCESGYKLHGSPRRMCVGEKWTGQPPSCIPGCSSPPTVPYAKFNFFGQRSTTGDDSKRIAEDSSVYYFCDNGYRMKLKSMSALKCVGGGWKGTLPICEKRNQCDTPMDIPNGNWIILSIYADFRIGSRVEYECDKGYKAIGLREIECLSTGYWSDYAPKCLLADQYCSEPKPIENGFYMCNPNHCNMFSVGTEVHYLCSKGYSVRPGSVNVQTCQVGGKWSKTDPTCIKDSEVNSTYGGLEFTSSTMTVVIVTSCTVLGLLLLVMLIVIIQRRNHPRRHHFLQHIQGQAPNQPDYERVHEARVVPAIDEHDRVALIAFADGVQVVLPTYEEATRGSLGRLSQTGRLHRYNSDSSRSSGRSGSTRGDYRPLPTIPYSVRHASYLREIPFDQRDHHRNSIITTTSSAIRGGDNLSLAFGSLDTVNISDNTSTTVTLGTYDSGASNPSLALSQRGVTGSLASSCSNPSVATEDAPLIEQSDPSTSIVHRSQTASPSILEETEGEHIDDIVHK